MQRRTLFKLAGTTALGMALAPKLMAENQVSKATSTKVLHLNFNENALGMSEKAKQVIVNAQTLAETLQQEGFTIVSGGTDTHVLLVDLRTVGLTGKVAEHVLDEVGITCNKEDMKEIASIISLVLKQPEDAAVLAEAKQRVAALCEKYPMYA